MRALSSLTEQIKHVEWLGKERNPEDKQTEE